jgi:hypothetical protein
MCQYGLRYENSNQVEWGYVLRHFDADILKEEQDNCDGETMVTRTVWISPARLEANGEFQGW